MKAHERVAAGIVALALAAVLTSCAPEQVAVEPPPPPPSDTPTVTPTPAPSSTSDSNSEDLLFTQPGDCNDILPPDRLAGFSNGGLSLLGGPGGSKFGEQYFSEPTPEERAGGITCVWGDDSSDFSSFVISVAPLSPANRPSVITQLADLGLNTTTRDTAQIYWVLGDDTTEPAQFNAIRSDSWISVISTAGGQPAFEVASAIGAEVAGMVYSSAG